MDRRTHRFLPGATLVDSDENPYLERVFYHKDEIGSSGVFTQRRVVRDFRGKTITQRFDIQERLAEKVLPPINNNEVGTTNTFFYDDSLAGQLEKVVSGGDVNRTNFYAYDAQRRLKRKDTPEGVIAYHYRNDGLLSTMKGYRRGAVSVNADPTAATPDVDVAYGYDQLGRLHSVTNNALNTNNVTTYQYDTVGNLEKVVYPNNVEHRYSYTEQNRLKYLAVTNTANTVLLRSYTYDLSATGQRTGVTESNSVAGVVGQRWRVVYDYDQDYNTPATLLHRVNRLTRESLFDRTNAVAGTITHAYDLVGNRVNLNVSLTFTPEESYGNKSLNFYERDWIDGNNDPSDTNSNYDRNGNTIVDETDTATGDVYDAENRLIQRGATITIGYDHEGNRVQKEVNGSSTYYLVDDRNPTGYVQVLAEYGDTSAAPVRSYVYGNDLISQTLNSGTYYYCYDGHGSVRVLVGEAGTELNSYDYDGYGKLLTKAGQVENNYLYTGEQWDPNLGMYFLRARYYRPELGRFWTLDSFEGNQTDPLSLHKYLYCHANPVMNIDPSGHESLTGMQWVTLISVGINAWSAGANLRAKNYAGFVIDMIGAGAGVYSLFGSILPSAFQLAGQGIAAANTAREMAIIARGTSLLIASTDLLTVFAKLAGEEHHIMTDKNTRSSAPDGEGPYTPKFEELLRGTGIEFQDDINKVIVQGHRGPHPAANKYTYDALVEAVRGLQRGSQAYTDAIRKELASLGKEAATPGTTLNKMLTGQ